MARKPLQPINNSQKTLSAIVQDRIRDAILEGALPDGARIDQAKLAQDLNVSLVPVREALNKLQAEGFVEIIPRRGAFVTSISTRDMEDLYFARQVLEGQAAYFAAEKLTQPDVEHLAELTNSMDAALHEHDYARFNELNHDFHFTIYNAVGSRYLINMITTLWELAERYRYRYLFLRDRSETIQAEHREILAACQAHDKSRLRNAIIHHMQQTMIGIRSYIPHKAALATPHNGSESE